MTQVTVGNGVVDSAGSLALRTNGTTTAVTIDTSQNVGIGTTSPNFESGTGKGLQVNYSAGLGAHLKLTDSASGSGATDGFDIYAYNTSGYIENYEAGATIFRNGGAEAARIDASRNLLVGANSTVSSARFYAVGSVADNVARVVNSNASPSGFLVNYSGATPNGGNNPFLSGYDGDYSNLRYKMASNGGLYNYSANNSNLSDSREKTNVSPAGNYLDKICSIPVRTYNYIDQNLEEDDGLTLGVFAQDVQAVAPELVTESNWAAEGQEPKMRLSIYQTDMQYALMKCIQEQQAQISSQAAVITTLSERITALEAK